jgi:hypothetical protein
MRPKMKHKIRSKKEKHKFAISDSDNEYYALSPLSDEESKNSKEKEPQETEKPIYLIHNKCTNSEDPKIEKFLSFCISNGLFDNTFYDYNNTFSVMATKLHLTFEKLSKDGVDVNKRTFIRKFKNDFKYDGDMNFIYKKFDLKNKGFVTWTEFVDFFLPFIQYVTV